jgi:hypothetical protein
VLSEDGILSTPAGDQVRDRGGVPDAGIASCKIVQGEASGRKVIDHSEQVVPRCHAMLGRPVNCRYIVVGRFIWLGDPDITEPTFLPRGEIERSGVVRSDGAMDIKIIRVCAKKAARNEGAEGDAVFRIDWAGWNRRSRSYRDDDGGGC